MTRLGRAATVNVALTFGVIAAICVSLSVGEFAIPLADVLGEIVGRGSPDAHLVIHEFRMPRTVLAAATGAAFGLSGAVFQSLARNPLASPDIIGITAGATAGAVLVIVLNLGGTLAISAGALGGGLGAAIAVYLFAMRRGAPPGRLILVGIAIAALLTATTSYLLTRARIYDAQRATIWLTGSLNSADWPKAQFGLVSAIALAIAVALLARSLRTLQLGDDLAGGLGVAVERHRGLLLLAATALAATATATCGPIAFVAFVAGPIARQLTRGTLALTTSALIGALLLVASDVVARRVFAPTELPVGLITGVLGAPYLMWLLVRMNRHATV